MYMKDTARNRQFLLFSLLLTILFTCPYWSRDFLAIEMDTFFHLARLQSLGESIRRLDLYPLVFTSQNGYFGYGSPLFYNNIFLWPFALLYALHVPLTICYKLLIESFTWLSAYTMLHFLYAITNRKRASLLTTAIWIFCSYRISDVYVRGALGEVLAMAFLPLFLESAYRLLFTKQPAKIQLALSTTALIMSHNLTFAMAMALLIIFLLVFRNHLTKTKSKDIGKSLLAAFLLTAWFTLPMLEQLYSQKFYLHYYAASMDLQMEALTISQFLQYSISFGVGGYGMAQGSAMTLSPGYLLLCFPFFCKINKQDTFTKFCFFAGLFFTLAPLNLFPWKLLPFLRILQFPWRLETIGCLLLALPCAKGIQYLLQNRKITVFLALLILGDGMFRLLPACKRTFGITSHTPDTFLTDGKLIDPYYSATYMRTQLAGGDYVPIHSPDFRYYQPTIHTPAGTVLSPISESRLPAYQFTTAESGEMILPITWYKGYCVYQIQNDAEKAITTTGSAQGLVQCTIMEPGTYVCRYQATPLTKFSFFLSLFSGLCLIYKYRRLNPFAKDHLQIL